MPHQTTLDSRILTMLGRLIQGLSATMLTPDIITYWSRHTEEAAKRVMNALCDPLIKIKAAFEPYYMINGLITIGPNEMWKDEACRDSYYQRMQQVPWTIGQLTRLGKLAQKWETQAVLWHVDPNLGSDLESIMKWSQLYFSSEHPEFGEGKFDVFRKLMRMSEESRKKLWINSGMSVQSLATPILSATSDPWQWRLGFTKPPSWSLSSKLKDQLGLAKNYGLSVVPIEELVYMQCLLERSGKKYDQMISWRTSTGLNHNNAHLGLACYKDVKPLPYSLHLASIPDDGGFSETGLAVGGMPTSCL